MPVAVITGANGGIGSNMVMRFAELGFVVIACFHEKYDQISQVEARILGEEIKPPYGFGIMSHSFDVRDRAAVQAFADHLGDQHNSIDLLINSAGVTRDRTLKKMTDEEWDTVIDTNLTGTFNVTRALLPLMENSTNGCIINISSVIGKAGAFGQTNYAASKAGIIGFTKALANEVASKGVRVNAIAPGFINTPMTEEMPVEIKEILTEEYILMGEFGIPCDVTHAAKFLWENEYVTGAVIDVNGGMA